MIKSILEMGKTFGHTYLTVINAFYRNYENKKMKKQLYCVLVSCVVLMVSACQHIPREEYIDFLKVSDTTYLGVSQLTDSLEVPWDLQFNPTTKSIFFTEIKGQISELNLATNKRTIIYTVPHVFQKRSMGLLGLALHPDFDKKPYLYVCYTIKDGEHYFSELAKLRYVEGKIVESKVLLKIGGALGHNGSRLLFDKERLLYWATGDAHSNTNSQDSTNLNGKVLRMTDEGLIPSDNPISNSYVYAWGFRNIQGMAMTSKGHLMTSEHGDAIEDEINLVKPLHNYGWKEIEGFHDTDAEKEIARHSSRTEPIKAWTPVIAPAAISYYGSQAIPEWSNSLLLTTLKNQSFRVLKLDAEQQVIADEKVYFKNHYGRIRAVTIDDTGNIYIATSNRDWNPQNGFPQKGDDRILKLAVIDFVPKEFLMAYEPENKKISDGKVLYQSYCASCHKNDGKGVRNSFPPLIQTPTITDAHKLVTVLLKGLKGKNVINGEEYDEEMPAFGFLSDADVATIATYIRTHFGNNLGSIDSAMVKDIRMTTHK